MKVERREMSTAELPLVKVRVGKTATMSPGICSQTATATLDSIMVVDLT